MHNTNIIRIALGTALILLIPFVLTLLGDGVDGEGWNWTPLDFAFMGALLFGTGLAYELVARKAGSIAYRAGIGVALAAGFLLVWMNAAVGLISNGDLIGSANVMYVGVLAVGFVGARIARFQPRGMARALFATALAQMLVAAIAQITMIDEKIAELGLRFMILNGFFATLWVGSAWLFQKAAGGEAEPGPA